MNHCVIYSQNILVCFLFALLTEHTPQKSSVYLEPVNGAAVDERREHAQTVPKGVPYGAEGQHHVQVAPYALYELVVHVERCDLCLGVLQLGNHLHL